MTTCINLFDCPVLYTFVTVGTSSVFVTSGVYLAQLNLEVAPPRHQWLQFFVLVTLCIPCNAGAITKQTRCYEYGRALIIRKGTDHVGL